MTGDYLEYGALTVLAATITGGFALIRIFAMPLLKDILSTNKELRDLARALREAMASMGLRVEEIRHKLGEIGDQVDDLHYDRFDTKRGIKIRSKDGGG